MKVHKPCVAPLHMAVHCMNVLQCALHEYAAVRRRVMHVLQVKTFINVFTVTHSLVAAALNITSFSQAATWPTTSSSCAYGDRVTDTSIAVGGGLGRNDSNLVYDLSFFSYAGCRCISGYQNVYTFDAKGTSTEQLLQPWFIDALLDLQCASMLAGGIQA